MDDDTQIKSLLIRFGVSPSTDEASILKDLYTDAVAQVLDYTNRTKMTGTMAVYAKQLAVIAYNRMNTEGETQRNEGSVSRYFEKGIPLDIQQSLNRYRRVVFKKVSR